MSAGTYLHIPFCKSRCSYCDFATDIYRSSGAVNRYVEALCKEIRSFGKATQNSQADDPAVIDTIYLGGGTPSMLMPNQLERILDSVHEIFAVAADSEVTMEMNPATVTFETLTAFRSLGVNRASFGVQTFNDRDLKLLARGHDANDARRTYSMLRDAGFENISFDLIAGLPGQTLDDWRRNLDEAIAMSPEHLSLYLLEIHDGTPLADQVSHGRRPMPDEDVAAEMYELMCDRLDAAGYEQYEISNFARTAFGSRHNIKYWRLEPVYGFGVSAHSFDGIERYANDRDTSRYVDLIETGKTAEVSREMIDAVAEYVFLGLRLNDGISHADFATTFGRPFAAVFGSQLIELQQLGLVANDDERLRLTRRGRLFSNEVFTRFI